MESPACTSPLSLNSGLQFEISLFLKKQTPTLSKAGTWKTRSNFSYPLFVVADSVKIDDSTHI